MKLEPFALERYFAKYEFNVKYLLSSSDCDGYKQSEVIGWADDECAALWDELTLGYTESYGLPQLRSEIAATYDTATNDNILVCTPEEGIFIALNSLLQAGDHVVCSWPGYQSLYSISESIGCDVSYWTPKEEGGWHFNIEDLQASINEKTKMIIINFPHNPTGATVSTADFSKIIEIAKKNNLIIFSDEMYRGLEFDITTRLPAAADVYDRGISLSGMSKVYGLAGTRIGWLYIKEGGFFENIATFKDYTTICSSAPSELLALIALRNGEKIIKDKLEIINNNILKFERFMEKHKNLFNWNSPEAGTIGLVRLANDKSAEEFCQSAITEAGIMLLPSTVYNFGDKHFRIGFGRANFSDALAQLEIHLENSNVN